MTRPAEILDHNIDCLVEAQEALDRVQLDEAGRRYDIQPIQDAIIRLSR